MLTPRDAAEDAQPNSREMCGIILFDSKSDIGTPSRRIKPTNLDNRKFDTGAQKQTRLLSASFEPIRGGAQHPSSCPKFLHISFWPRGPPKILQTHHKTHAQFFFLLHVYLSIYLSSKNFLF